MSEDQNGRKEGCKMSLSALANALKQSRKAAKLTKVAVANKIGVAPRTIARWENATREPGFEMLLQLADCYGTSISKLMERVESELR